MIRKAILRGLISSALVCGLIIGSPSSANAGNATGCFYKGIYLAGKVKVVTAFPDLKIQMVKAFPDLKVQQVKAFPDKCGKWQFVNAFPDFTVQIVKAFPDIKVQFVNAFPGTR
jgi:hypothetical protein